MTAPTTEQRLTDLEARADALERIEQLRRELLVEDQKHTLDRVRDLLRDVLASDRQEINQVFTIDRQSVRELAKQVAASGTLTLILLEALYDRGLLTPDNVGARMRRMVVSGEVTQNQAETFADLAEDFRRWRREQGRLDVPPDDQAGR